MPDWQKLVRKRLSGLALDAAEKDEVHAELAAHLEETYEGLLKEGEAEAAAIQRVLSLAGEWQDLRRKIQEARRKGNNMTNRVRQLWLPGFVTLFTSMSLLILIDFFGTRAQVVHVQPNDAYNVSLQLRSWSVIAPVAVVYVPWLLTLLLIGASGAYLSYRAGASQRIVFLSILFPVLPYSTTFLIGFPLSLILGEKNFTHNIMFSAFLVGLVAWVLLPGAALLAGGLPTQLLLSRRLSARGSLSN
ncbi:MAG TPA: hypothetical protein VGR55_11230 [Candidatus Acidoferrum sp.]|nr:hypothetical protein [Candidatus Acidoferrum sp.]